MGTLKTDLIIEFEEMPVDSFITITMTDGSSDNITMEGVWWTFTTELTDKVASCSACEFVTNYLNYLKEHGLKIDTFTSYL